MSEFVISVKMVEPGIAPWLDTKPIDADWAPGYSSAKRVLRLAEQWYTPIPPHNHWPRISAILLELLGDPSVAEVRYGRDGDDIDALSPFTVHDLIELSANWVTANNPPTATRQTLSAEEFGKAAMEALYGEIE